MSHTKQKAISVIERMPDTATSADILDELYFMEQVDRGMQDVIEGRTLTHDELKKRIADWRKLAGR
jgi:predicted transcriptional regulator